MIDKVFFIYLAFICIRAIARLSIEHADNGFWNNVVGLLIGFPLGLGFSFLVSAGILWIIIGILSFFGVSSVGIWTVGFSWTAVKVVMMVFFLLSLFKRG